MARNLRLIESLWRYGIGGDLARFGCNLTRSVYLTLDSTSMQLRTVAGYLMIGVIGVSFVIWNIYRDQIPSEFYDLRELPVLVHATLYLAPTSGLILWGWMLLDAISSKALKARGWWLV